MPIAGRSPTCARTPAKPAGPSAADSYDQMKNFLIVILVIGAVGYYFDISPTDFLPSIPNSPPLRGEKHTSAVAVKDVTPQPAAAPTATPDNGSLANRWKP